MSTLGPESGTSGAGDDGSVTGSSELPDQVASTTADAVPGPEVSPRKKKRKRNPTEQDKQDTSSDDVGGACILLGFRGEPAPASDRGNQANPAADNQEAPAPAPRPMPVPVPATITDPVLLSDPLDGDNLTTAFQFYRRQIELFTADSDDVVARHRKGGVKQEIYVGQVGIRCVHCAHLSKKEPPSGSVSFPASISLVYQAVRNWQSKLWRVWLTNSSPSFLLGWLGTNSTYCCITYSH